MAVYFENCKINGYRSLDNFELKELGDVNIIVGDNNSGKTSILEALNIVSNTGDFYSIVRTARERERAVQFSRLESTVWESFINIFNRNSEELFFDITCDTNRGRVSSKLQGNIENVLHDVSEDWVYREYERNSNDAETTLEEMEGFLGEYEYHFPTRRTKNSNDIHNVENVEFFQSTRILGRGRKDKYINCKYLSAADYLFGRHFANIIKDKQLLIRVIKMLQKFDQDITDLRIFDENGRIVQMVEKKSMGYMPISSYGDGVKRVIAFVSSIASAENGVLLIDEIETGIHSKAMEKVFKFVVELCMEYHIQLFLTTHSEEALKKLIHVDNNECNMRVITLIKKEKTLVRNLSRERALRAIEEYGQELR